MKQTEIEARLRIVYEAGLGIAVKQELLLSSILTSRGET